MDVEARNFTVIDEELGQWRHTKPIILHFDKLLFHTVWPSQREETELCLLLVNLAELIDQMTTIWVIEDEVIPLKHL